MSDILVLDDHEPNLLLYAKVLGKIDGAVPQCFTDPVAALKWTDTRRPVLVVIDQTMPDLTGLEFMKQLRSRPGLGGTPFMMVTANNERELRREAMAAGALGFLGKPVDPVEFLHLASNIVGTDRGRRDAVARAELQTARSRESLANLQTRDGVLIDALFAAMRVRDAALAEHGERVAALSVKLATRLGVAVDDRTHMAKAVLVHDVGKLGFSDKVLCSPYHANPTDTAMLREHVAFSKTMLGSGADDSALLKMAQMVAATHHERWDGTGYPHGLVRDAIPLPGRIVAVADAFVAMTSVRPYRAAMSPGHALAMLETGRGAAYDPRVVAALRTQLSEGG